MNKIKLNNQKKIGIIILICMILFVMAGFLNRFSFDGMNKDLILKGPTFSHPFGCDEFGRDILKRTQTGMGISVIISFFSVLIGTFFGTLIGALCGYFGGVIDDFLSAVIDVLFSIPSLLLALVFVSLFGSGMVQVTLALGIAIIPSFSKMMRSEFRKHRELEYVKMAKLMKVPTARILFVHILPNVTETFINCVFIAFNNCILAEAGLSFLGIGVQPPLASLGTLLSDAGGYIRSAPYMVFFPALTLIIMLFGIGLLSSGESFHHAYSKRFKN
ncbi:MAG: ABC transporter permease [Lachnospiraceae bacterium]|nr:ABC transporter permease [Lachnospiraceae bacterium]